MAKVKFLNQAELFVRKLHFSTSWYYIYNKPESEGTSFRK